MNNNSVFFINILPSNDQKQWGDYYTKLDEFIDRSSDPFFSHTLVTVGNKRVDSWVTAQYGLAKSANFKPLIAINPLYQNPVTIAKKVFDTQNLYRKDLALNFISGSFINELVSMGENQDFSFRNQRLREFLEIFNSLISQGAPCSYKGSFYNYEQVEIYPNTTSHKTKVFVSGTFETAPFNQDENFYFLKNSRPISMTDTATALNSGLGLGICTRPTDEEAFEAVKKLYPEDRKGQFLFSLSLSNNATPWNVWLKNYLKQNSGLDSSFYLRPLMNFQSSAPFLVGSYEKVRTLIQNYVSLKYRFFLLDFHPEDFVHVKTCLTGL